MLPRVAHRQWTLSLPMGLRFHVVKQPALLKRLEVRLVRAVWRLQRATARRLGHEGTPTGGAVRFWQYSRYEYSPKKGVAFVLTAEALVKRLGALTPPPNRHLTSFHGVYAPNAKLRPLVVTPRAPTPEATAPSPPTHARAVSPPPRLDWATLHQRTFGTDVLQCPCGGRRTVRRVHLTRKAAEARLVELGVVLPSRLLPRPTAPPQLLLEV
ncbi:MAG: hypothetical protein IT380_29925 [Myxococcales bacterium]|nr:hypothetical protein [Myxococcales bacterium]